MKRVFTVIRGGRFERTHTTVSEQKTARVKYQDQKGFIEKCRSLVHDELSFDGQVQLHRSLSC